MSKQQGFALVLVLWVLSLLTIMAGSFALSMRRESAIITGIKNNAQAMAVAESGIAIAEMMLLNPDKLKRWHPDGSVYQIDYAASNHIGAKVRLQLFAEMGKIDINAANQKLLEALMQHAPINPEASNHDTAEEHATKLVNAIMDWRDENDDVHLNGAEKKQYQDAGLHYQPRNKPFQTVEELQLVLGMDSTTFAWLEPLVTVYSGQQNVAIQDADSAVLQVLPALDAALIADYLVARRDSAINDLPAPPLPLIAGQTASAAAASQPDSVITLTAEALMDDDSTAVISAIIKKSDGAQLTPFQVLKWQRNPASRASLFTDEMSELLVKQYAESEFNH